MTRIDLDDLPERAPLRIDRVNIAGYGRPWREAESGKRFRVTDPADGSTITDVADAAAVERAAAAVEAVLEQAEQCLPAGGVIAPPARPI